MKGHMFIYSDDKHCHILCSSGLDGSHCCFWKHLLLLIAMVCFKNEVYIYKYTRYKYY